MVKCTDGDIICGDWKKYCIAKITNPFNKGFDPSFNTPEYQDALDSDEILLPDPETIFSAF